IVGGGHFPRMCAELQVPDRQHPLVGRLPPCGLVMLLAGSSVLAGGILLAGSPLAGGGKGSGESHRREQKNNADHRDLPPGWAVKGKGGPVSRPAPSSASLFSRGRRRR